MVDLALCEEDSGQSKLTEGSASDAVAVAKSDDELRLSTCGGKVAQRLEGLACLSGERPMVEGADPGRLSVLRCPV